MADFFFFVYLSHETNFSRYETTFRPLRIHIILQHSQRTRHLSFPHRCTSRSQCDKQYCNTPFATLFHSGTRYCHHRKRQGERTRNHFERAVCTQCRRPSQPARRQSLRRRSTRCHRQPSSEGKCQHHADRHRPASSDARSHRLDRR